jgi:hypothetical protein
MMMLEEEYCEGIMGDEALCQEFRELDIEWVPVMYPILGQIRDILHDQLVHGPALGDENEYYLCYIISGMDIKWAVQEKMRMVIHKLLGDCTTLNEWVKRRTAEPVFNDDLVQTRINWVNWMCRQLVARNIYHQTKGF